MRHFASLELKIRELEQRNAQREGVLQQVLRASEVNIQAELDACNRTWQTKLDRKVCFCWLI
jgi:hypothetical protein